MPTNTKTKAEKAAIKRRQRARKRRGEKTEAEKVTETNLLGEMKKTPDAKVQAVARLAERNLTRAPDLRPELASRIIRYMLRGHHISTSCAAVGVRERTFARWMKKAAEAIDAAEAAVDAEGERLAAEASRLEESGDEEGAETVRQAAGDLSPYDFMPSTLRIYCHLYEAVNIAQARGEMALMERAASGERGWQGAMAVLERRHATKWGKKSEVNHHISGDADNPVVITYEAPEERKKRVAGILDASGALEGSGREVLPADDQPPASLPPAENSTSEE